MYCNSIPFRFGLLLQHVFIKLDVDSTIWSGGIKRREIPSGWAGGADHEVDP